MYPPHQPQWPQQHYPQPPQNDPVKAAATRALIMSLIAVPLCCAKWAGDKGIASALKDDLKKNYETAASKKLRELSDGKLRLGFSPLD